MKYKQFEDMPIWKEARRFVYEIYQICNPVSFKNDFDLMRQIRRASASVLLNIAEGFERKSNKDFARFINNAKASAGEARCGLYIALDAGYISEKLFNDFLDKTISISNQLSKFGKYLIDSNR